MATASETEIPQGVMNVAREDQDKINRFAKLNSLLEDIKDEISTKTTEIENHNYSLMDVEEKALLDEDKDLYLKVGDIMVELHPTKITALVENRVKQFKREIHDLESKKEDIVKEMGELKAHLYARFGNNIHLESSS